MKTILCYGDSNTYGAIPGGGRYDHQTRWPCVLRSELGEGYWVIEEGCGGRTTVWEDPVEGGHKSGADYLPPCLHSHGPLDLVIIMLGTNDLKHRFGLLPDDIARGAGMLADICRKSGEGPDGGAPKVLLVAPPPLAALAGTPLADMFTGGEEKSRRLGECFARIAAEAKCEFFDAGKVIGSSPRDAIHFEAGEHVKLGRAIARLVVRLLGDQR